MEIKQISMFRFLKSKKLKEMLKELSIEIKLFDYKFRTKNSTIVFRIPKNTIEN